MYDGRKYSGRIVSNTGTIMKHIPVVFFAAFLFCGCSGNQQSAIADDAHAVTRESVDVTEDPGPPPPPDDRASTTTTGITAPAASESVAQHGVDASGNIPCAQFIGQPMGQCLFRVSRGKSGSATVAITHPDGRTRIIFFENGQATNADLGQADSSMNFHASKQGDLFIIEVGDERYEIPDAVIFSG